MTFPTIENFLSQLHELHYGTSRHNRKPILPKHLLDAISSPIANLYDLEFFRTLNPQKLANPRRTFEVFLTANFRALNRFRDALPPEAFEEEKPALLIETKVLDLSNANEHFAQIIRSNKTELAAVGITGDYYPDYYRNFNEPEPLFTDNEPSATAEKVQWRNDRRHFENHELADWKERKLQYDISQKEFRREYSEQEQTFFGLPHYHFWTGFYRQHFYKVPFVIPDELRFAHQFVLAPSRSGKTNFLRCQILGDLERVARGECSVVVMDSHNSLLPQLAKLKLGLDVLYLEPLKYSLSLNIFDRGDTASFSEEERTSLYRDALRTTMFFINSIARTETTGPQDTVLNFLIQAVMTLPEPTVRDLHRLLQKDGLAEYRGRFQGLDPDVLRFLEKDMHTDFGPSVTAVRNRILTLFLDPLFRKMFATYKNRLDLFEELKTPKLILVNTAGLGEATRAFGRYFIAKLHEAMLKRQFERNKLPVFCYVDEAHDYISDEPLIAKIIDTVGKQNLGMIFATQREKQFTDLNVLDALQHVAIQCVPRKPIVEVLLDPQNNPGAMPLNIQLPYLELDSLPQLTEAEQKALQQRMRDRFSAGEETPKPPPPASIDETDAKPW